MYTESQKLKVNLFDLFPLARIRKAEPRKQAKGLRKVHLRDCLINAMEKKKKIKQKNRSRGKQTDVGPHQANSEESTKSNHSENPKSVININGEVQEYKTQEDIKNTTQRECEVCFSLAHSTPIMSTLLGK